MAGFTGLKIEEHSRLPGQTVCIAYENGERVAAVYFHPEKGNLLSIVYEGARARALVQRRIPGTIEFEGVWYK